MTRTSSAEPLRARILRWLAPLREGSGFQLDECETEQGITLLFRRGARRLVIELERADHARPCFATTERFNVYYEGLRRQGKLEPDESAVLERVVALLRENEGEVTLTDLSAPSRRLLVREIEVDRALVFEGPGAYYMNPYVGCMLGCPFCYAIHRADFSRSLEGLPLTEWGRWADVKVNLPEVLAREVREKPPGTVRMSPIITDPYQPIERKYKITRGCLEALGGTRFVPALLTRSSLILRDLDVLRACHEPMVGMSVPTDDDGVRAEFEPNTEPVEARVATLRGLHDAGVITFAIVQPMLPLDPARLVELLAPAVRAVRIGPMFEKHRSLAVYQRRGQEALSSETWERKTFEDLKQRFEDRGVLVNPEYAPWNVLR